MTVGSNKDNRDKSVGSRGDNEDKGNALILGSIEKKHESNGVDMKLDPIMVTSMVLGVLLKGYEFGIPDRGNGNGEANAARSLGKYNAEGEVLVIVGVV